MILSRRVALGGVQLDELDDSIVIRSIDPGVPTETIQAANRMGGSGQRITGQHFENLEATVAFAIDIPKTDLERRREVFDAAMSWAARKGWLTLSRMPDRRLYVDKTIFPSSGDLWAWTDEYALGFRAYNVPFWQEEKAVEASTSLAATSGRVSLQIKGNVESVVDVSFENKSGTTVNSLWITANNNTIALTNLGLGGSETLTISHGTDGLLRIMAGNRSVYEKYSGADDLYVSPGNAAIAYESDRVGILRVSNNGRWI